MSAEALLAKGTVRVSEIPARFGIPRSCIYELMAKGAIPWTRAGKSRLVPVVAIEALLARNMVGVVAAAGQVANG